MVKALQVALEHLSPCTTHPALTWNMEKALPAVQFTCPMECVEMTNVSEGEAWQSGFLNVPFGIF
jgi:hypothetical protein